MNLNAEVQCSSYMFVCAEEGFRRNKTYDDSLTLHIDGEGAREEERLEGWHGPTSLAVAQLLWDRLLPAHSWVSAGRHRGLDLRPAAAGQAWAG